MAALGRCRGWSERCWPLVCRWMCAAAKKKKKGKRSWKKNIAIKIVQNSKGTVCTRPLWLRLYLPLLPVSAWPPPLSYLLFDHFPFFLETSLLLWLHTRGRTHAPFLHVFSSFFSSFPSLPGHHLDFDQHHSLEHPFPLSCSSFAVSPPSPAVPLVCLCLCSCGFNIPQFLQQTRITHCSYSQPRSLDSVAL